jgi:hypothetical protein
MLKIVVYLHIVIIPGFVGQKYITPGLITFHCLSAKKSILLIHSWGYISISPDYEYLLSRSKKVHSPFFEGKFLFDSKEYVGKLAIHTIQEFFEANELSKKELSKWMHAIIFDPEKIDAVADKVDFILTKD